MVNKEVLISKPFLKVCVERIVLYYDRSRNGEFDRIDIERLEIAWFNVKRARLVTGFDTLNKDIDDLRKLIS